MNDWFKEFYNGQDFAKVTYSTRAQVAQYLEFLASAMLYAKQTRIQPGMKLLDQCCGIGSFANEAASQLAIDAVGIDTSEKHIEEAKQGSSSKKAKFIVGDVREWFDLEAFDICTCWHTSCAYSLDDATNLKQFKCMSSSLKRNGLFVVDTINPDYVHKHFISKKADIDDLGNIIARVYSLDKDNVLSSKWTVVDKNDNVSHFAGMTKMYSSNQYQEMLGSVGLKVVDVVGSYRFDDLADDCGRMILYGVKE